MNFRLEKLSVDFGQATGDKIIVATVDSVEADDIEVYFVEEHTEWQTCAKIDGVHSNNTIFFYTPTYVNAEITSNVKVSVQLRRPSDGARSNVLPFTFVPSLTNIDIPIQEQMNMHSNLKDTHFTESVQLASEKKCYKKQRRKCQDVVDSGHPAQTAGESSKPANFQKVKTIHKESCDNIKGQFQQEVKSSLELRRVHSPDTGTQRNKLPRLQHLKKMSVSEASGFGSYVTSSNNEEQLSQELVPKFGNCSQQSTRSLSEDASQNESDVELDCMSQMVSRESIPRQLKLIDIPKSIHFLGNSQESVSSGYGSLTTPEYILCTDSPVDQHVKEAVVSIGSNRAIDCKIHYPAMGTKAEVIPHIKVDCSGACLKVPRTGVQLIIPPYAIPEGEIPEIGLALDWNHLNIPGEDQNDGCIAPIITCLPNHYQFEKPVLIVFPHSAKETFEDKECLKLYTSNNDPGQKKDWKQVKYNQKDDASHPILYLKNRYAYLFVRHFTDHIITLLSGEYNARYMSIIVYANELHDCETTQDVRIYCHGEQDDLKEGIEKREKSLNGIMRIFKDKFELIEKCNADLKVSITKEIGWSMKSPKKEQLLKGLWRKHYGSCQYTFKNIGNMSEFYCRISIQQVDCDDVDELEFTSRVKNLPPAPLRGPSECYVPPSTVQPSTDSGHESSFSHTSASYKYTVTERYCGPHSLQTCDYEILRQMSCPESMHQNGNLPTMSPPKLPYPLRIELGYKLDAHNPLGNDWRMLANELNLAHLIGKLDSRSLEPTLNILTIWESLDETLEMLEAHLHAIKRPDAAKLITNYIAEMNQNTTQQVLANASNNNLAICAPDAHPRNDNLSAGSPNLSSTSTQERIVGRQDYRSSQDKTDGKSSAGDTTYSMSTSSSASSFAVTPDQEVGHPNFQRTSSDVFYDENVSTLTRSIEDLTVEENANAIISSNKHS